MKPARKYLHSGKLKTLTEWAAIKGLDVTTLRTRVNAGWPKSRWFDAPFSNGTKPRGKGQP